LLDPVDGFFMPFLFTGALLSFTSDCTGERPSEEPPVLVAGTCLIFFGLAFTDTFVSHLFLLVFDIVDYGIKPYRDLLNLPRRKFC
jgi:hypothetical protein